MEESGALAIQARTASSHAEVLAGASSGEKLNGSKLSRVYLLHVAEARNVRPAVREDAVARGVILYLPCAAEAGRFQPKI